MGFNMPFSCMYIMSLGHLHPITISSPLLFMSPTSTFTLGSCMCTLASDPMNFIMICLQERGWELVYKPCTLYRGHTTEEGLPVPHQSLSASKSSEVGRAS